MLPLDEEPLKIDANRRNITIPQSFKMGTSVQGDIVAETLIFEIDRYFDAIDFNDCDIYVQWERPNDTTQYVTPLTSINGELLDITTYPGKMRFGWPLSEEVTKTPGTIKFSVRFIKYAGDVMVYSFSTQTASMTIMPGLNYDIANAKADSASDLFDSIIQNSETSVGVAAAKPFFETNLPEGINYLGADNTLALSAMADSTDNGDIRYEWYKAASATSVGSRIKEDSPEERKATNYQIALANGSVVGYYWVKAINRLTNREKSAYSNKVYLPGANAPVITANPVDDFLGAKLSITLAADEHGEHNKPSFSWMKKASAMDENFSVIEGAEDSNEYVPAAPGYYKAVVTNTVNGDSQSIESASCVVYNTPVAIVFADTEDVKMTLGTQPTLAVTEPTGEFDSKGDIKYSWWIDYTGGDGILENGKLPVQGDKSALYLDGLTTPTIEITASLIDAVRGNRIVCVAANTITLGEKTITTYSESQKYEVSNY